MIKLKDLITEEISATEVNKLEKMPTPKTMEIEYVDMKGKKQKHKYKVTKDKRFGSSRFLTLKNLKPEPKVFNNYQLVIDERKLKIQLRAVMGYATSKIAKSILKVNAR